MDNTISHLRYLAQKSPLNMQHGCAILSGNKIISSSYNTSRGKLKGLVCCSGHAEQCAILSLYRGYIRWDGYKWCILRQRSCPKYSKEPKENEVSCDPG